MTSKQNTSLPASMNAKRILYLGLDPTHYPEKVTHYPIIEVIPRNLSDPDIHHALSQFEKYTHVIVTSKTTVSILQQYLKNKMCIAVGKITAHHLQSCGVASLIVSQEETGEGIVETLKTLDLKNAHIFWPHSSKARPLIRDYLKKAKITHTVCSLYDTEIAASKPLPDLNHFDEIVFTSPSTVEAFLKVFGKPPPHLQLTPIGPVTAKALVNCRLF